MPAFEIPDQVGCRVHQAIVDYFHQLLSPKVILAFSLRIHSTPRESIWLTFLELATNKIGTLLAPRDQGSDGGLVSFDLTPSLVSVASRIHLRGLEPNVGAVPAELRSYSNLPCPCASRSTAQE